MKLLFTYIVSGYLIWTFCDAHHHINHDLQSAVVELRPVSTSNVEGTLTIEPTSRGLHIKGEIRGLTSGLHGFHIHEFGDLGNDCKNAGGHFNPFNYDHGDPRDLKRHVGDLGNIRADQFGVAQVNLFDCFPSLEPFSKVSIINRAIVVHAGKDDVGRGGNAESLKTGNAGSRVACGIIQLKPQEEPPIPVTEPQQNLDVQVQTQQYQTQEQQTQHGIQRETQQQTQQHSQDQQTQQQTHQQTHQTQGGFPEQPIQQHIQATVASVVMVPGSASHLSGDLIITSTPQGTLIQGQITGLSPGLHGFHIHEKGDLGNGCKNAGGHFNPYQKNHGAPQDSERHIGDLGNIYADDTGTATINVTDHLITLDSSSPAFIGNLAVVVHAGEDDLGRVNNSGSLTTGNAGARAGCGIIEFNQNKEIIFPDPNDLSSYQNDDFAVVKLQPGFDSRAEGTLTISPMSNGIVIRGTISGLTPGKHGFHIHEKGDLGNGCKNAGGHFNPLRANHGAPTDTERHVGDLGNIEANSEGKSYIEIYDAIASLNPASEAYIGHLAIVVHAGEDDLGTGGDSGSLKTGNAGARVACGIIEIEKFNRRTEVIPTIPSVETAVVRLIPGDNSYLDGELLIMATSDGIIITGQVRGLSPGLHGFHIHEKGDLGNGCKNAGGHFNPFGANHGGPIDSERHVGDLGNIEANSDGVANLRIFDKMPSLDPSSAAYIGNRAVVVHGGVDDLGKGQNAESLKTGNAGARVGCGIIEIETQPQLQKAFVDLQPSSISTVVGQLLLIDTNNGIFIEGQIGNLTPGKHGFHIHENGDLGNDCKNAGGHFNPFGANHGAPNDKNRHVGDLGNIEADSNGVATVRIFDNIACLNSTLQTYIGNLAIVVHAGEDDLGRGYNAESHKTGNAGARVACGIIDHQHHQFPQNAQNSLQHEEVPQQIQTIQQQQEFSQQTQSFPQQIQTIEQPEQFYQQAQHTHQERHSITSRQKRSLVDQYFHAPFSGHFQTSASSHFHGDTKRARAKVIPGNSTKVHGHIEFEDVHSGLIVKGVIYGLSPGLHGFHIHEKGGLGNKCQDAGGHFNPFDKDHGDVHDFHRHVGDLGNIKANAKGIAKIHIFDHKGSLDPHSKTFVGFRAVVVHANPDDLGRGNDESSRRTGNSGTRVGCGLIELHPKLSNPHHHQPHGHSTAPHPHGQLPHHHQPHHKPIPHPHQPHHGGSSYSQQPHHGQTFHSQQPHGGQAHNIHQPQSGHAHNIHQLHGGHNPIHQHPHGQLPFHGAVATHHQTYHGHGLPYRRNKKHSTHKKLPTHKKHLHHEPVKSHASKHQDTQHYNVPVYQPTMKPQLKLGLDDGHGSSYNNFF